MKRKIIFLISFFLFAMPLLNLIEIKAQDGEETPENVVPVNVAFGTVAQNDLLGAVSSISVSDLIKKNYSTSPLSGIQALVGGYTGNIWGQTPLILVDGVPRSQWNGLWSVNATEVESVTIMKGANSVALYGSRAAKGVVLITTKRGVEKPLSINLRANTGFYVPKSYPAYLNGAEYMTLYNEACRNDGINELYGPSLIYNTAAGTNSYRYPDVDFYTSEFLKKVYNRTDATGEITGGNRNARYYSNFGLAYNNGLLKYVDGKGDNDLQFNVRTNVDMRLTDWLTAAVDAAVTMNDSYRRSGSGTFWSTASELRPNWFSPLIPLSMIDENNSSLESMLETSGRTIDGKYLLGGLSANLTNSLADMYAGGYSRYKNRAFLFNVNLGADLGMFLEGLSFKTAYSVDYNTNYNEQWQEEYAVYQPNWSTMNGDDLIVGLTKYNVDKPSTSENIGVALYAQTMSFSAQFNYNRTFAQNHHVSGTLLGWGFQTQDARDSDSDGGSSYHRLSNANLGLQATYNFRHKYYFDFSGAVVHSAKLPEGNRNALSPAVTLGWRMSDESFFNAPFVDNLKWTVSYANLKQDIDISDFYLYQGYYDTRGPWVARDPGSTWATIARRADNPDMTFIQRQEFRVGLETSLLNRLIVLDANYFMQNTDGLLTQGSNTIFPSYYSSLYPWMNYNKDKRTGVDFTLTLNKNIGEVYASVGFSGMYFTSEAVTRDETYEDDYQYRAGKPLDSFWGLISEGFFENQADIDGHARQTFGDVKPGDIKYKDVNGDGVIDNKDQVDLGHNGWSVSPFTYGVHLTLKWKGLTLYAWGTGRTGAIGFKDGTYNWVYGARKYSEVVWGRWTEGTKNMATYPRLSTTSNTNNFRNSTFWMYDYNRFDLSKVQLTYDFPKKIFGDSFVNDLSVYISGENLLTISKERKWMETTIGGAPQIRFFNLGCKVSF